MQNNKKIKFTPENILHGILIVLFVIVMFSKNIELKITERGVGQAETEQQDFNPLLSKNESEEVFQKPKQLIEDFKPPEARSISIKLKKRFYPSVLLNSENFLLNKCQWTQEDIDNALHICRDYVRKYARLAVNEYKKYGVLPSYTLAQGLIESNAANSFLYNNTGNHFGIKCKRITGKTSKGFNIMCKNSRHCFPREDDDPKDRFIKAVSAKASFRQHSELLQKDRYKKVLEAGTNYKEATQELENAFYASDRKYNEKLNAIIKALDLDRFDI